MTADDSRGSSILTFSLDEAQYKIYDKWEREQDKIVYAKQKAEFEEKKDGPCDSCAGSGKYKDGKCFICLGSGKYTLTPFAASALKNGHGYYGSFGGYVQFEFIQTTIGDDVKVRHLVTGNVLDLNIYEP